jgi:Acyl-CoA carboxylase epsilon subunit
MSSDFVVRVARGHADPEELAAVTAVLMARAAARSAAAEEEPPTLAHWRRLERAPGFYAPHSWQAVA